MEDSIDVNRPSPDAGVLLEQVYSELRRIAEARIARAGGAASLVPTELVHEAYLRLQASGPEVDDHGAFLAAAAESMRRILVERARAKGTLKRGENRFEWLQAEPADDKPDERLLELDEFLTVLEQKDARLALLVKLRFFAGLTLDQTAAALESSPRQVQRDWSLARAWLRMRLEGGGGS